MMNNCKYCDKPLNKSQWRKNGEYKSCPKCSKNNEREHVYYKYPDKFGTTDKRITKTNPDGAQSYCVDCRGGSNISNNSDSRLCSEFEQ